MFMIYLGMTWVALHKGMSAVDQITSLFRGHSM